MRVVLDTNIFVSGMFWPGNPCKILSAWRQGKFELVVSTATLAELKRVLTDFKIKLLDNLLSDWFRAIIENAILVEPPESLNVITEDESDNRFVECAVAAHADYIVSGDNHLLSLKNYNETKILSPKEFVEIVLEQIE